jgi:VIT1/CCC1 family predicted Fe2+/Mn2+ transporter
LADHKVVGLIAFLDSLLPLITALEWNREMTRHKERHLLQRIGWLRAAVLGANDGIISTASLILGVASAQSPQSSLLLTGIAGLVAGSMSMAAGEYVSVSSQADTENADLNKEKAELANDINFEREELAQVYVSRGLEIGLAREVATQLMKKDALGAHARDELGISEISTARPIQAALSSAASFTAGAVAPLAIVLFSPLNTIIPAVAIGSLCFLALLGAIGAWAGGANLLRATFRVALWGALAMALTSAIGALFGTSV